MAPGRKTGGGSRAGKPNRLTSTAREAWGKAWTELAPDVATWIREVHDGVGGGEDGRKPDPAKATELALKMAEYHVPKLAQQALTGADGGPLTIVVQTLAEVGDGRNDSMGDAARGPEAGVGGGAGND